MDCLTAEFREAADGQSFRGTILTEGRAAQDRLELFAPGSAVWPHTGIRILNEHRGRSLATAIPERSADGAIVVTAPATPELREAVKVKPFMSIEFHALEERTTGRIREVMRAFIDAAALVASPAYPQTAAELRTQDHRKAIWDLLHGSWAAKSALGTSPRRS